MELRKIRYYPNLSEETIAFNAQIWEEGKKKAYVTNKGHGGNNELTPAKGFSYKDIAKWDNIDEECKIMEFVLEDDLIKKKQSKKFILKKDNQLFTAKFPEKKSITALKKHSNYEELVSKQLVNYYNDGFEVLNRNL